MEGREIREIFKDELTRMQEFVKKFQMDDEFIHFDYSKTHLAEPDIAKYRYKFDNMAMKEKIEEMFQGKKINFTENRKVLHVACRDKDVIRKFEIGDSIILEDEKLKSYNELVKMRDFSKVIAEKKLAGATGKIIDTIVNIGIGGSDLGPRMVCEALQYYKVDGLKVHFISNVDAVDTFLVFEKIDPERTLFIVVSKTFTTQETIENAKLAKALFLKKTGLDENTIAEFHFVAVTSNIEEAKNFGIHKTFGMGDYIGGRYSLWSAVGLSICIYIGFENFLNLLRGASLMDEHFRVTPITANIPITHAIVELFYNNECHFDNKCIIPYDQYLVKLSSYLQQAEMESNGKTAAKSDISEYNTGMIIWGDAGTNAQHSFFQLIHQGTRNILCEFLVGINPVHSCCEKKEMHHKILYANCLAQSAALMNGKEDENLHKNFPGNKGSITIVYSKLTPKVLGSLIAMYEHKIFVQGLYWNINSYDQFGVELGKKLAKGIYENLNDATSVVDKYDPSTSFLMSLKKKHCKK